MLQRASGEHRERPEARTGCVEDGVADGGGERDQGRFARARRRQIPAVEKHGFDTKFGYHVVRLVGEVEQILVEGDIDLQRNNEPLKAIRRGEWTEDRLRGWFAEKESQLERAYAESTLRATPDEGRIKALLLNCLEEHYGSLEGCIVDPDRATVALRNIQAELDRVKDLL